MDIHERTHLEAERQFLLRRLEAISPGDILTRVGAESRIKSIDALINSDEKQAPLAKARLTFSGSPVKRSHGILAEFSARASGAFAEAVTQVGASLRGPLASKGPVPNRHECQLLLTNIALGSFGFEFEEQRTDQLPFGEPSLANQALMHTLEVMRVSVGGDDDSLAEAITLIGPRPTGSVREFVKTLSDNGAICTLAVGATSFSFRNLEQIMTSLERLSQDNVREEHTTLSGTFLGVLPNGRSFEFTTSADEKIIRGKISADIEDPSIINRHLGEFATISVKQIIVGVGSPRYELLSIPEWP